MQWLSSHLFFTWRWVRCGILHMTGAPYTSVWKLKMLYSSQQQMSAVLLWMLQHAHWEPNCTVKLWTAVLAATVVSNHYQQKYKKKCFLYKCEICSIFIFANFPNLNYFVCSYTVCPADVSLTRAFLNHLSFFDLWHIKTWCWIRGLQFQWLEGISVLNGGIKIQN